MRRALIAKMLLGISLLSASCAHEIAPSAGASAEGPSAPATAPGAVERTEGRTAEGSHWAIEMPAHWNGTVLLFSHGYTHGPANPPRNRTRKGAELLLARGYALIGGSYRSTGWALEHAVPDQIALLDIFAARFGEPQRVLAYGESMGGLITLALAERYPERVHGAMPMCASVSGVVGMMNQALDGAFALKTLVDPAAPIRIVGITTPGEGFRPEIRDEGPAVDALIAKAMASASGRARLALAAAFAQLPAWPDSRFPEPAADDLDARIDGYARTFAAGVFFPRRDQEQRAGGNASWNTGLDYRAQLDRSGRRTEIEAIYRKAGLNLDADLQALDRAPRIAADPGALRYMRENYVPHGRLDRPILSLHTTDDGLTMVTYEQALADLVAQAGRSAHLRQAYVHRAGHCSFSGGEVVAGIAALDHRVATGRWDEAAVKSKTLNAAANAAEPDAGRFLDYRPAPMLRPCGARPGSCAGEPSASGGRRR